MIGRNYDKLSRLTLRRESKLYKGRGKGGGCSIEVVAITTILDSSCILHFVAFF